MAGAPDPEAANRLRVDNIVHIVDTLRKTYDYVMIDLGRALSKISLPIIRTAPDHGTAFGIAGQGRARAESMAAAITTASASRVSVITVSRISCAVVTRRSRGPSGG